VQAGNQRETDIKDGSCALRNYSSSYTDFECFLICNKSSKKLNEEFVQETFVRVVAIIISHKNQLSNPNSGYRDRLFPQ